LQKPNRTVTMITTKVGEESAATAPPAPGSR